MGDITRAGLPELAKAHNLNFFVETGTGNGRSLIMALQIPEFLMCFSVEIDYTTYIENVERFTGNDRVTLLHGDSVDVLPDLAKVLAPRARVGWWLDAHFPGSARGVPMLPLSTTFEDAAPLERELRVLRAVRDLSNDVVMIDDRCLYEADTYGQGDYPEFREQLKTSNMAFVDELLAPTHVVHRLSIDGGYVVCTPR